MKKLSVAFLWHMHQPLYKDLVTGKYHLPWVRLHSTYSYLDMAALMDVYPEAKCTFNITPSLIWQLRDIGGKKPVDDEYLKLTAKDAAHLEEDQRRFILKNFFSCDLEKAIFPIKEYKELFYKRGNDLSDKALTEKLKHFKDQELLDLQVFFNLAWCGFTLKDNDKTVRELLKKGSGYTEDDKKALLKVQHEVVRSILPTYKRLQEEGKIEISTTPFYHPILPLLCGRDGEQGYDFREDAEVHVKRAIDLYREVFGKEPVGMWPAEGSVSQAIIPILAKQGVKWIATDEGILIESFRGEGIPREDLIYKAYKAEEAGKKIDMVFRDINLSNAISFKYANIPPKKAAHELLADLVGIHRSIDKKKGDHVAAIILDGENPWPYYPDGGKTFLGEVYHYLSSSKHLEPVTIGGFLGKKRERGRIERLYAGSWIDRNFRKWIGSPQKNKAWDYLSRARKEIFSHEEKPSPELLEELYIAEGSDWFWWYDDFGSELNFVFDDLFRLHLSNIYKMMGREVPHYLGEPIHAGPLVQDLQVGAYAGEMARYPKVLFVTSEAVPFAKTGGLADVSGSLPKALAELGCEVDVVMPLYKCVSESGFDHTKAASHVKGTLHDGLFGFDLYSSRDGMVNTYFVANRHLFEREGIYGTSKGDYPDNAMRFGFFSKAVLNMVKALGMKPDVIHCNDWQTGLVPFYLRFMLREDEYYRAVRTLFTIHNMAYQGVFHKKFLKRLDIPEGFFNMNDLEFYGQMNFMKSGILYSNAVSTVSHRYAEEIMTPQFGCGLDGLLRARKDHLFGIPNGVDYSVWNPRRDKYIAANYSEGNVEDKAACKKDLIKYTGLSVGEDEPLVGCVTRFADQKGMDLVANAMGRIVSMGCGVVILGRGSKAYNRLIKGLARKYPGRVYVCTDFNDPLAHKIEAGCDIFLMPSRYEPCGLNQMYSIKYGTVPVVRATGGLDDAIVDIDADRQSGNGFKFGPDTENAMLATLKRAVDIYTGNKALWKKIMVQGMKCDFSWERSAKQYVTLYRMIMG